MTKLSKVQDSSKDSPSSWAGPVDRSVPETSLRIRMYWGDILYDTSLFPLKGSVTVGRNPNNTFIVDLDRTFVDDHWEMVSFKGDGSAEITFSPSVVGHIKRDKKIIPLRKLAGLKESVVSSDGVQRLALGQQDEADLSFGYVSFYLDWVHEKRTIAHSKAVETKSGAFFLGIACLLAVVMVFMRDVIPPTPIVEAPPERIVTILPRHAVPKRIAPAPTKFLGAPAKAAIGPRKTKDGGAQKGELGKAKLAVPKAPDAATQIRNSNLGSLVKGLSALEGNIPAGGRAAKGSGEGFPSASNQTGTGGFSTEGLKTGGGGKSVGIGRTSGQGEGGFEGTGRLGLAGNSRLEGGTGRGGGAGTITEGGLDRELIDSIVKRRQDRIRLCYERQLNFSPGLSGKITVGFTIGKLGQVVSTKLVEDTMKNSSVNSCVLSEVKGWSFPPPKGGTLVSVDYPFVFESGGTGQ